MNTFIITIAIFCFLYPFGLMIYNFCKRNITITNQKGDSIVISKKTKIEEIRIFLNFVKTLMLILILSSCSFKDDAFDIKYNTERAKIFGKSENVIWRKNHNVADTTYYLEIVFIDAKTTKFVVPKDLFFQETPKLVTVIYEEDLESEMHFDLGTVININQNKAYVYSDNFLNSFVIPKTMVDSTNEVYILTQ
jgi:hypothetical protein